VCVCATGNDYWNQSLDADELERHAREAGAQIIP
jgi:hypothetical protein